MKLIQRHSELPNLSDVKNLVFDTEGSGLSPYHGDRISGICISPLESRDPEHNYYIPIRQKLYDDGYTNLEEANVLRWLNDQVLSRPDKTIIGHHLKFDLNMLRAEGIECVCNLYDTLPAAHVYNGSLWSYEMDVLTRLYLPGFEHVHMKAKEEWLKQNNPKVGNHEGNTAQNYSLLPMMLIANYGCEDIDATRSLANFLLQQPVWDRIPNQGYPAWTSRELLENEMKLVKVLARMEWNGAAIDLERCCELRDKTNEEIEHLSEQLGRLAGRGFSILSWKDTWDAFERAGGRVLYWGAKEKKGKQKSQQFTTDRAQSTNRPCWNAVAIMNYLDIFKKEGNTKAYEFVRILREAQQRQRLVSTNLDVYIKKCDANGRIHGQFHQHRTITGRLSSTDPNEQNVAVTKGNADLKAMEKVVGKKDEEALSRQLRGLFIAEFGCAFVSMDWSQVEYRAAAFLSNDPILLQRYRNDPSCDYHTATSEIVGIDRDLAKTVNFLSLYGGGPSALSAKLTASGKPTTIDEAKAILNRLFEKRPALKNLISQMSEWARRRGYVQNQFGRRCSVPSRLDYIATNYAVQGACGDAMRNALVRVAAMIQDQKLPVRMILTVHDEIDMQMPKAVVHELAPKLAAEMCKVPQFGVPLLSDIEVGENWGELLSLKEWLEKRAA